MLPVVILLAAAAPPAVLVPVGPWLLKADGQTCYVSRDYVSDKGTTRIAFQPLFNSKQMDVTVLAPATTDDLQSGEASVRTDPAGDDLKGRFYSVRESDGQRVTRLTVSRDLFAALDTADTLSVHARFLKVTVKIVQFDRARAAFNKCQGELLSSWGADQGSLDPDRTPTPHDLAGLFQPDSYPVEAVRSRLFGRVISVLLVDTQGAVTGCHVVASAGEELNAGTCRQGMKARFDPAHDPTGKPLPSIYVLRVQWALPTRS